VHHQQHGIAALLATNAHPLIDAADQNERRLVDPGTRAFGRDNRRDDDPHEKPARQNRERAANEAHVHG